MAYTGSRVYRHFDFAYGRDSWRKDYRFGPPPKVVNLPHKPYDLMFRELFSSQLRKKLGLLGGDKIKKLKRAGITQNGMKSGEGYCIVLYYPGRQGVSQAYSPPPC